MITDSDLKKIELLLDQKLEEKLEVKLDEKLDGELIHYSSKEYLKGVLDTKLGLYATKRELKEYTSKEELKEILKPYATKEDLQIGLQTMQDTIINQINIIIEIVGEQNEKIDKAHEKIDKALAKIDSVKITTNNHEQRITTLEKHKMN